MQQGSGWHGHSVTDLPQQSRTLLACHLLGEEERRTFRTLPCKLLTTYCQLLTTYQRNYLSWKTCAGRQAVSSVAAVDVLYSTRVSPLSAEAFTHRTGSSSTVRYGHMYLGTCGSSSEAARSPSRFMFRYAKGSSPRYRYRVPSRGRGTCTSAQPGEGQSTALCRQHSTA